MVLTWFVGGGFQRVVSRLIDKGFSFCGLVSHSAHVVNMGPTAFGHVMKYPPISCIDLGRP